MNAALPPQALAALPQEDAAGVSRQSFRNAMALLPAAVHIITTDGPAGKAGITASAVCSRFANTSTNRWWRPTPPSPCPSPPPASSRRATPTTRRATRPPRSMRETISRDMSTILSAAA